MEVIALLTADRVQGYDDPNVLLEAIIDQGIIEEFTRAIPMGLIGPLVFAGKYFPNLLLHDGSGKLVLNPLIMNEIKRVKREMARQDMAEWMVYWSVPEERYNAPDCNGPPVSGGYALRSTYAYERCVTSGVSGVRFLTEKLPPEAM
jgi:hypothetical protein